MKTHHKINLKRVENPILYPNLNMKFFHFSFRSVRKYIENLVHIYDRFWRKYPVLTTAFVSRKVSITYK